MTGLDAYFDRQLDAYQGDDDTCPVCGLLPEPCTCPAYEPEPEEPW